jgi:hypothetical protein
MSFENGESNWLTGIKDVEGENPFNWIHSGSNKTAGSEDAYYSKNDGKIQSFYDPNQQFGKILNSTWAPYPLCASYYSVSSSGGTSPARIFCGPGFNGKAWEFDENILTMYGVTQKTQSSPDLFGSCDLRKLSSSLIVLTKDKSKWTRCVVLEMQEKSALSEGNAIFFSPRNHKSVNKNGEVSKGSADSNSPDDPNYISATGMGWFPGYAINLETGERLNMAFGEDSYQKENNGNDMIWNPTSNINYPFAYSFGGKHFVYVFGGKSVSGKFWEQTPPLIFNDDFVGDGTNAKEYGVGRYDKGKRIIDLLHSYFVPKILKTADKMNSSNLAPFYAVERDIIWAGIPIPRAGKEFKDGDPSNMLSDVRIQINVAKPYRYGFSGVATVSNQPYSTFNQLPSVSNPSMLTTHVSVKAQNNNFPLYSFNTSDIATLFKDNATAVNSLDQIRVVPNPYYGSSSYETKRLENFVRITNLPNKCTVKIFSMNGTLIRTIKRDVTGQEDLYTGTSSSNGDIIKKSKRISYVEWDLKNQNNISIASGLYIIHVDAPGIGENVVKWFGIMRPLDVQNY